MNEETEPVITERGWIAHFIYTIQLSKRYQSIGKSIHNSSVAYSTWGRFIDWCGYKDPS